MRAVLIGGTLILLVGGFFIIRTLWDTTPPEESPSPSASEEKSNTESAPTISADVIRQKMQNGERVVFLDVRDQAAFDGEHIPHSIPTSPSTLASYTADANALVVIVLSNADTQRKEVVATLLKQRSSPAFLLAGGIEEWKLSGNQLISRGDPNSFVDQSKVTYVTPAEAVKMMTETVGGLTILDVQSEQNYQRKHIKGAINIPLQQLEKRSRELSAGKNILVYGENELASFQGGTLLNDLSFFTARTLRGNDHLKPGSGFILEP